MTILEKIKDLASKAMTNEEIYDEVYVYAEFKSYEELVSTVEVYDGAITVQKIDDFSALMTMPQLAHDAEALVEHLKKNGFTNIIWFLASELENDEAASEVSSTLLEDGYFVVNSNMEIINTKPFASIDQARGSLPEFSIVSKKALEKLTEKAKVDKSPLAQTLRDAMSDYGKARSAGKNDQETRDLGAMIGKIRNSLRRRKSD